MVSLRAVLYWTALGVTISLVSSSALGSCPSENSTETPPGALRASPIFSVPCPG